MLILGNVYTLKCCMDYERKMKCHNGQLRNEQDATLWLRPGLQKKKLGWKEYIPFAVLGALLLGLLMDSLF